jgi:GT2 family glycosyltransferase
MTSNITAKLSTGSIDNSGAHNGHETSMPELTVIIPTRNRKKTLRQALESYAHQSVDPRKFDVIIVDDGSQDGTSDDVASYCKDLPFKIALMKQPPGGPAKARNFAISQAQGDLVLITGDDIIPDGNLIQVHLDVHAKHPDPRVAVLGFVNWHPDLEITDFMTYITQIDGHQFAYHHIADPNDVDFGYFYTSNVSLKTSFLRQNGQFSESFRYAACEDIELGYRLKQCGMRLVFVPEAIGYHLHPMDLESFSQRQFHVGQMMALLLHLHPGIVDVPPPPPPEQVLERISKVKTTLDQLESYLAKRDILSDQEAQQVRQLRFDIYRQLIYGYQALGLCEERRLQGFPSTQ